MDIVLEFVDTYVYDYIYAWAFPISQVAALSSSSYKDFANITLDQYGSPVVANYNNFQFKPASQYISVSPSQYAYQTSIPRDDPLRQFIALYLITVIFGMIVYFFFASLSYFFIFDHATAKEPKFLKNQVRLEIMQSVTSMPLMALFTAPLFWLEVRGYSRIYDTSAQGPGRWYDIVQFPLFLAFTDYWIYWIHRGLHHPRVYKHLHKPHHKWLLPTPFASHAFHPIDGFSQSIPYHVYPFLFPMQKYAYVLLFIFINIWTIMIHDGEFVSNNPIVNGAACHSIHHMEFTGNYGQFSTFPDRLGGTYKAPDQSMFCKISGKVIEPKSQIKPRKLD